jgi:hypothetical protein
MGRAADFGAAGAWDYTMAVSNLANLPGARPELPATLPAGVRWLLRPLWPQVLAWASAYSYRQLLAQRADQPLVRLALAFERGALRPDLAALAAACRDYYPASRQQRRCLLRSLCLCQVCPWPWAATCDLILVQVEVRRASGYSLFETPAGVAELQAWATWLNAEPVRAARAAALRQQVADQLAAADPQWWAATALLTTLHSLGWHNLTAGAPAGPGRRWTWDAA